MTIMGTIERCLASMSVLNSALWMPSIQASGAICAPLNLTASAMLPPSVFIYRYLLFMRRIGFWA
jgi:hypothetical protein